MILLGCVMSKLENFNGGKTGLIFEMLWFTSSSVEQFEFFFVASMLILNLAVVNTFWAISSRSRLVHGCIHGPCIKSMDLG